MKFIFHIIPNKSRLFPLNPVYSPAFGILFDGYIKIARIEKDKNVEVILAWHPIQEYRGGGGNQ